MKNTLYKALCILALSLSVQACGKKEEDTAPVVQEDTKVTIDNYNRITVGMTLAQVVAILGNGKQVNSTTYTWSADNTNTIVITLVFVNGVVQTRSQVGLASSGSTTGGSTTGGSSSGSCPATYNGHTVYTGPRGGCYYLNSSGNKVYI